MEDADAIQGEPGATPPLLRPRHFPATNSSPIFGSTAPPDDQFHLDGITEQLTKCYVVLAALPEVTVDLIADLVKAPELPETPSTELRHCLLQANTHRLSVGRAAFQPPP